ncbi:YadA-like family protein [Veillonella ratti]|uniref:YadA-like family protein n=1 Tax=Veillonella ratti TaxID=103892 RepID=UPI000F8EE7B8|nr:YadA-like family protein [Veillonella ratti]
MSKKSRALLVVSLLTSSVLYPGLGVLAADLTDDQQAVYDAVIAEFNSRFSDLESRTDALVRETANIPTFNESDRGISIGEGAVATEVSNIAIGYKANAGTEYSSHIAIGSLSEALGGQSIAIGNGARANTGFTIAIGHNADVARDDGESSDSIGIGTNLVNRGMRTILIGGENGSQSEPITSNFAIGIGYHAIPGDTGVAIGEWSSSGLWGNSMGAGANAKGEKSLALGFQAHASDEGDISLGHQAYSANTGAISLGHKAFAIGENTVAIGRQSYAVNKSEIVESYLSDEHIYPQDGVVSVGNADYQLGDELISERHRRITNMAGGVDDYDAANIKQLKALKREIDDVDKKVTAGGSSTKYVSFNSSEEGNKANDGATGGNSMAVGPNAKATGDGSTAVGWNAEATGIGHSAAYGANAKAVGQGSLAVGPGAEAYGKSGLAIGNGAISNTETLDESSIAIGDRVEAKGDGSIGMGIKSIASGKRSIAMGIQTQATGNYSMAIGGYSNASGADSIALGHNAVAATSSSVAIGAKSVADRGYDTYGYTVDHATFTSDAELLTYLGKIDEYNATVDAIAANKKDYKEKDAAWRADRNNDELRVAAEQANAKLVASQQALLKLTAAYKSYFGAVSVGTDFATRQIINVAAGTEDTDAVNVAQLKALNVKVDDNSVKYFSVKPTYYDDNTELVEETVNADNQGATGRSSMAIGAGATTNASNSLAIGHKATISDDSANGQMAIGYKATASGQESVALGSAASAEGVSVAIGGSAKSTSLGVAVGYNAKSNGSGGISVGNNAESSFRTVAVGVGAQGNSESSVAVGSEAATFANSSVATGSKSAVYGSGSIAIGTEAVVKSTVITPDEYNALSDDEKAGYVGAAFETDKFGEKTPTQYMKIENGDAFYNGMAIGPKASATYEGAVAIGRNVTANGGVAIGQNSSSTSEHSVAIGLGSVAGDSLQADVAIGNVAKAAGYSVAIGNGASAFMEPDPEYGEGGLAVAIGSGAVVSGQGGVAVGQGSKAVFQSNAMGSLAKATARGAVAIGDTTEATGQGTVAIGNRAEADSTGGIAIGTYTKGLGYGTIGIGISAEATGNWSMAMGQSSVASAKKSTALGSYSTASGGASMALGYDSASSGGASTALGYKSVAKANNGVALGSYSIADRGSKVEGYNIDGLTFASDAEMAAYLGKAEAYQAANADFEAKLAVYNNKKAALEADPNNEQLKNEFAEAEAATQASFEARNAIVAAYRSTLGAISVGSDVDTRQITNVAAGSEDTDAVNVAQLKALNTKVDTNKIEYVSINSSEEGNKLNDGAVAKDTIAIGPNVKTTVEAGVAIGRNIDSKGGVAVGEEAYSSSRHSVAIGYGAVAGDDLQADVAIGDGAKAREYSVAIGNGADAFMDPDPKSNASGLAVAIGSGAKVKGQGSVAIGSGSLAEFSSSAMGIDAKANGRNAVSIGDRSNATGDSTVAIGTEAKTDSVYGVAIGPTAKGLGFGSVGIGGGAEATANWSMAMGQTAVVSAQLGTALGHFSNVSSKNSTAIGSYARVTGGTDATAVGYKAQTTAGSSVALGANSLADRAGGVYGYTVDGVTLSTATEVAAYLGKTDEYQAANEDFNAKLAVFNEKKAALENDPNNAQLKAELNEAGAATQASFDARNAIVSAYRSGSGAVSVGSLGNTRQIINVAAGSEDTDAVNVAQLKKVKENVNKGWTLGVSRLPGAVTNESEAKGEATTITPGGEVVLRAERGIKLNQDGKFVDIGLKFIDMDLGGNPTDADAKASGGASLAVGQHSIADGHQSTAIGWFTHAGANAFAGGTSADASGDYSIAIGSNAKATATGAVAIGSGKRIDENNPASDYRKVDSEWGIAVGDEAAVDNQSKAATATGYRSEVSTSEWGSAYGATSKVTGSKLGTSIGASAKVESSENGTAVGAFAKVIGSQSGVAMGVSSGVSNSVYGTAIGPSAKVTNSHSGISIGSMANVNGAPYGMAVGINSSVTNQGGVALGYGAVVSELSGVALGLGAVANRNAEFYGYSPDGITFTDDASIAAYLGKTAEFEQANQDYVEKVRVYQEKLAAYQQNPTDSEAIRAVQEAGNNMTASFNKRTSIIAAYKPSYGAVSVGGSGATRQIINVAAGTEDSDAVNLAQLKTVETIAKAHTELTLDGKSAKAGADGALGEYIGENNLTMAVKDVNGQKVYDLKLKNEVVIGQPGKDGKDGTPGSIGLVGPQGPAGEDGQPGKNAYGEISVKNGVDGVDGKHGKDGITRIVYEDERGEEHTVATLEDGLKFAGDTENVTIAKKLNETLDIKGGISDTSLLTDNNIGVVAKADGGLTVKLSKDLSLSDGSVAFAETAKDKDGNALVKGEDGNWYTDLTDAVYDADSQTYTKDGETLQAAPNPVIGTVKLSSTGLDNGNQRIVNVATGIDGTDAVNVDQLDAAISKVSSDVGGAHTELTLDGKSAKAGADGALGDYIGENNLTMAVKDVNGQKVYDLKLKNEVVIGQPGKDGKDGTPGSIGLVGPQGPAGEDGQPGKNAYGEISVKNGVDGVDGKHGKDGITRIVYEDERGEEHTVATLEDGLKFAGDTENVTIAKKLNETLDIKGGISDTDLLTDNNIGVVAKADGGLTVKLAKNLNLADGSVRIGGTTTEDGTLTGGIYIASQKDVPTTKDGKTEDGLFITGLTNTKWNPDANGIVSGRAATEDQLNAAISKVSEAVGGAHTELTLDGKEATAGADGALGEYIGENNLTMAVKDVNGQKVYDLKLKNEVVIGQPGKDGKDGTPGSIGLVGPQGPAGEDGQPGKNAYGEISVKNGVDGVDGKHGKDGITRIVYEDENGEEHTVATLEDGLKFAGDTENVTIAKKLNETLDIKGGISDTSLLTDNNIGVVAQDKGGLTVKLAKNLNLSDGSVAFAETAKDKDGNALVKGEDGNWYTDLTDAVYDAATQTYTKDGAAFTAVESPVVGAVKLSSTGLDNGNQRIVNVAAGINGMDAVNVDQLDAAISKVSSDVGGAHTELMLDGKSANAGADGALGEYIGENNLTMAVKDVNGQKVYDLKLKNEVVIGQPGKDGKDGTPGSIGLVGPQGPAGEDGQPGKNAYGEISVKNGVDGVDGKHGKEGITRIVYEDENGEEHTVATLEDGLKFAGDTKDVTIAKKLNETLTVTGGISDTDLLTDNNIGVVAKADGGLTVKLAKNLNLNDGSIRIGGTTAEDGTLTGGIYIANQKGVPTTKDGKTEDGLFITGLTNTKWNLDANGIVSGRAATEDQLNAAISKVSSDVGGAHTELTLDGKSAKAGADGALGDYIGENNLTMAVKDVNGQKVYDLKLKNEVVIGQPGKDGKDGTPGSIGLVGPQGPAGEDGQPGKNAYAEISVKNGVDGVDGKHGKDGITRIVYEDENGEERVVATMDDGLKFAGDTENVTIAKKLNETLTVTGGISDASLLTDNNIGVVAEDKGGLTVKLAKNLNLADGSVAFAETAKDKDGNALVKGEDGNWYTDLTDAVYDADSQTYTKDGETLQAAPNPVIGTVKLSSTGLDNGNQRIVNVATGIDGTDAVNVDQLDAAISKVSSDVGGAHTELTLDGKSAKAGADGALGEYIGENNLTMAVKDVNGHKVYDLKLKNEVVIGQPGKDGKDGTPGSIGLVGPQGPAGEDGQPGKNAYAEISVKNGVDGVDGKHGKDGITRIVYEDERGEEHTVATLEDGLKFAGDTENVTIAKKLNETLEVKGGINDEGLLTDNNIGVVAKADGGLTVKLAKNLNLNDGSIRIGGTTAEDGTLTGGIYIANQKGVPTTKDGKTEDGLFITGLANTDWNPDENGIVEKRAATEKQLKAVADSSARLDAANLSEDNVNNWKTKLGITDTLLGEAGAWKLTVNGGNERAIKKDSVINFVNGEKVQITQDNNDIKVGLDSKFVEQVTNNTKNITNLDNRVTKVEGDVTNVKKDITKINNDITNINKDITNINTKIETIEGKAGVANVVGDTETGVKVEKVDDNDATKGVKVSLDETIKVGGITIDGKAPSEGETASRTITGLTNTKWDVDKVVDDRAATEGQLKDFASTIADSVGATKINGDDNINAVKVEGKNEYNLSLNDDLKVGNSIAVNNMTYISKDGINANDKEIKNVKAVELTAEGTSAATTGQVYTVRQEMATAIGGVATAVQNNARQISKLDSKVNKSGAGAAALAALHPLDYDPDNKWNFTAGMGTYHGSNAVALGAFYRPNENTLFSIGGSMGNGENMMNVGVSMKFGNSNPYAGMSKGRLIEYVEKQTSEIDDLKAQNESQNERIQKLEELVQSLMAAR